jgi:hypothetical protein
MTPPEALAQALHELHEDCFWHYSIAAPDSPKNHWYKTCDATFDIHKDAAAAILATDAMQTIARQAAIGAAVMDAWAEYQDCEMPGICTDIFMSAIAAALDPEDDR